MSDDLRIYGRWPGSGGGYQKPGGSLARFKKGRRPGDIVRGVFLSLEPTSPGTAWVNLEGERLLAQLPPEWMELARAIAASAGVGAAPGGPTESDFALRQGDACYFILESLEPEPRLRMLHLNDGGGSVFSGGATRESLESALAREQAGLLWRNVSALPPAQLASRYAGLRGKMDSMLKDLWADAPGALNMPDAADAPEVPGEAGPAANRGANPITRLTAHLAAAQAANRVTNRAAGMAANMPASRAAANRSRYLRFLAENFAAATVYAELNLYRAAFLLALKPYGLLSFSYLPWLYPAASAVELARVYKPREIFVLQATLPGGSRFEVSGKCELHGGLPPGSPQLHEILLKPGQPDLLGGLLALYPERVHSGFSRRT